MQGKERLLTRRTLVAGGVGAAVGAAITEGIHYLTSTPSTPLQTGGEAGASVIPRPKDNHYIEMDIFHGIWLSPGKDIKSISDKIDLEVRIAPPSRAVITEVLFTLNPVNLSNAIFSGKHQQEGTWMAFGAKFNEERQIWQAEIELGTFKPKDGYDLEFGCDIYGRTQSGEDVVTHSPDGRRKVKYKKQES